MRNIETQFDLNFKYYKAVLGAAQLAFKEQKIEDAIKIAGLAAEFCASNYCGFYADNEIETLLNRIGKRLLPIYKVNESAIGIIKNNDKELRILHYASLVAPVGGHTRLLENWIKQDSANTHCLFLGQQNEEIPQFVVDAVASKKGVIYQHGNEESYTSRINKLYNLVSKYDLVVLHHHPNDVIPVIAFAYADMPPVAVLNHGDHKYWVGSSICDNLIEFRDNLIPYDRERRSIEEFSVLPIPLKLPVQGGYEEARENLGISGDEVILLTVGSEYKYIPFEEKNFFEDIIDVLDTCLIAKIFIVGVSTSSLFAVKYRHPRIVYVDATPDLEVYKRACDIYVEGYPFSSFTSYLEVGALKKPIHLMYDATLLNQYFLSGYKYNPIYFEDRESWKANLLDLIYDFDARVEQGVLVYENISENHALPGWADYLTVFYASVRNKKHRIRQVSASKITATSNEIYLNKILYHGTVNLFNNIKNMSFNSKLLLAYRFFVSNNYSEFLFKKGENSLLEINKLEYIIKIPGFFGLLVSKKISALNLLHFIYARYKNKK